MSLNTMIDDLWESGEPHCSLAEEVKKFIKKHDAEGIFKFGGDGDNGEELMFVLDAFVQAQGESE